MGTPAFALSLVPRPTPGSIVPLYLQIADTIAAMIQTRGEAVVGCLLPSELECMSHFGVSRPTVRQAMADLTSRGLITRHKGRGTFVADSMLDHDIGRAFEDEMRASRRKSSFRLIKWERIPKSGELAQVFVHDMAKEVYHLLRKRLVDRKVLGFEERYIPLSIGDHLKAADLRTQSLVSLLAKITGRSQAEMQITVSSEAASDDDADLLEVEPGTVLLIRKNTCYFTPGHPVIYGVTKFVAQNYQFRFRTKLALNP